MDLSGPIHDFLLVFLGSGLLVGGLGVVLLPNPIFAAFSLGFVLVCISLLYILSNSHFVAFGDVSRSYPNRYFSIHVSISYRGYYISNSVFPHDKLKSLIVL